MSASTITNAAMKAIRERRGLSVNQVAAFLRMEPRSYRRLEDGSRDVLGPVAVLMEYLSSGVPPVIPEARYTPSAEGPTIAERMAAGESPIILAPGRRRG